MAATPTRFGRYPAPDHTIVHLSDTHLRADGAPLPGGVDTQAALELAASRIAELRMPVDAIVVTGDVSDDGTLDSYARVRAILRPVAERLGARIVWAMGNHDERPGFRVGLLDEPALDTPIDGVRVVGGLRIIALDSTTAGFHHGSIDGERLERLAGILAEPAPSGSVLALHHAPIASPLSTMDVLELRGQDELAAVLRGSDVRLILGGHLHYPTTGSFAGIPVSVAGAIAYTLDASAGPRGLVGLDGGRSFDLVEFRGDDVLVSTVPVNRARRLALFDDEFTAGLETLDDDGRIEAFSRKR